MNNMLLNGDVLNLDKYANVSNIIVKGFSTINSINVNKDLDLHIKIEKNATLVLNLFNMASDITINICIECYDNSKFVFNNSLIAEENYTLNIDTNLYGDNVINDVNIRGINETNGKVVITMNGQIAGKTKGCVLNEFAKIINKSENANVLIPNMVVNTNEVTANHGVSIGSINKEELFYLMSKGLTKSASEKMIEEGFVLTIMDETNREIIKNILIGR